MKACALLFILLLPSCATYDDPCPPGMEDMGDENGICTRVEIWFPVTGPATQTIAGLEIIHILVHDPSKTK